MDGRDTEMTVDRQIGGAEEKIWDLASLCLIQQALNLLALLLQ